MTMKKYWFAVEMDEEDGDWSTGSFDWNEAVEMAKRMNAYQIATIDGNYNEEGNETTDPVCIDVTLVSEI